MKLKKVVFVYLSLMILKAVPQLEQLLSFAMLLISTEDCFTFMACQKNYFY
jgi:hypothetical protein